MKHHLHLAPGLDLPLQAVTERFAFIGQSESGKTYAAMRLAELMLEVGAQVVALDPLGQWWGLRAAADGKHAGFKVTVFGGIHGDVPITPDTGELVARIIVERGISAVVDVSDFTSGQMAKFTSAFAALGQLRAAGLVHDLDDGRIELTDAGRHAAPAQPVAQTHEEVLAKWMSSASLTPGARTMLKILVDAWPLGMTRGDLVQRANVSEASSSTSIALSRLRGNGLVDDLPDRTIRASSTLFPEQAEARHG